VDTETWGARRRKKRQTAARRITTNLEGAILHMKKQANGEGVQGGSGAEAQVTDIPGEKEGNMRVGSGEIAMRDLKKQQEKERDSSAPQPPKVSSHREKVGRRTEDERRLTVGSWPNEMEQEKSMGRWVRKVQTFGSADAEGGKSPQLRTEQQEGAHQPVAAHPKNEAHQQGQRGNAEQK